MKLSGLRKLVYWKKKKKHVFTAVGELAGSACVTTTHQIVVTELKWLLPVCVCVYVCVCVCVDVNTSGAPDLHRAAELTGWDTAGGGVSLPACGNKNCSWR